MKIVFGGESLMPVHVTSHVVFFVGCARWFCSETVYGHINEVGHSGSVVRAPDCQSDRPGSSPSTAVSKIVQFHLHFWKKH